jgi:hypothetical protein
MRILRIPVTFGILLLCLGALGWAEDAHRRPLLSHPQFADYDAEPRLPNGRVDTDRLVSRLKEVGATTYYWLICHAPTDWDDLKLFLPKAAEAKLEVWAYLAPPSESPPHTKTCSEPFRCNYERWADEIARLSLQHSNLTAWVIDDFYGNAEVFTSAYVRQMQSHAKRTNPHLAFLPLMYFDEITRRFVDQYRETIDGVVVAYPQDRQEIDDAWAVLNDVARDTVFPRQLACPWNTSTKVGDFAAATVSAKVLAGNRQVVRFCQRDFCPWSRKGYHFKQLLLNDRLVWEEDMADENKKTNLREVTIDVSRYVHDKARIDLTFRLFEKKPVSNFSVRWHLMDLQTEGLEPVADFRKPEKWQASHRGGLEAGFGEALRPGQSQFHIPYIVMTAADAEEFQLRHDNPTSPQRMGDWLRMCLDARRNGKCDGVVTYCLDKGAGSEFFPLAAKLFHEYRRAAR